jgi:hypothetical protein
MEKFNEKIQEQFAKMCATGKLFKVKVTGKEIWKTYLNSFPQGTNPIFRDPESTVHNCNYCHNFIRRYGNVVAIDKKGDLITLFGATGIEEEYNVVAHECNIHILGSEIVDVFFETKKELQELAYAPIKTNQLTYKLGVAKNHKRYTKEEAELFGVVKANQVVTFNHFNLDLPKAFVYHGLSSLEAITAVYRDKYSVFKRGMEEISLDTLVLVKDLINQGSLLDGTAHLHAVSEMIDFKTVYDLIEFTNMKSSNWFWLQTYTMDERVAKFKNTLMGVLCTELSEGKEINEACKSWNKRVDPINYHKASAPISKRQIEEAQKFVEENGYTESFNRRLATIDDIKVSEILHSNIGDGTVKNVSIFDNVKSTSTRHKKSNFEKVEEVGIDAFMEDILPGCTSVEAFLKNSHESNMVTLTTPVNEDSKRIFKWNNNYSWTFNGNIAGKSQIKEAVKSKGGKVDGVLRFSIMWAEEDGDNSDLDAHCLEPNLNLIYFSNRSSIKTGGKLDIDITQPQRQMPKGAVENITYPSLKKMDNGKYSFIVYQYEGRNSKGFKAEIEFNGEIHYYEYNRPVRGKIKVADVELRSGAFTITHKLPSANGSKEIYGLESNNFHKVNLVCLSPNYWDDNLVGNLHYMFMLDKCKTPNATRGFHNENLLPDLLKHKKVMEVLGNTALIEPTDKQLSGLGFNSTVKDELIVKVKGSFSRMLKIKF